MLESLRSRGGKRWPRGQKFTLSAAGAAADIAYRDAVSSVRASGRSALEAAQQSWAGPLRVAPGDGVILGELRDARRSIADIARKLEDCGTTLADVKAAVDRLTDAGLVEPAIVPAAAA